LNINSKIGVNWLISNNLNSILTRRLGWPKMRGFSDRKA